MGRVQRTVSLGTCEQEGGEEVQFGFSRCCTIPSRAPGGGCWPTWRSPRGISQTCQSGSGAGPEKSMLTSRRQESRREGRWKDEMRAFVCNSNITYQQITGQRCLMKMCMMDVSGRGEEGRDGKSRHGACRGIQRYLCPLQSCCPGQGPPDLLAWSWNL